VADFDAERCAADLCRVFLGWRLREDYDALLALEEGALRVDLLSGEAWCDGDPLPPLFIAGELRRELEAALARAGLPAAALRAAELDAVFAGELGPAGAEPRLRIACRCTLATAAGSFAAEARTGDEGGGE
jgi:hypothetical protein